VPQEHIPEYGRCHKDRKLVLIEITHASLVEEEQLKNLPNALYPQCLLKMLAD
jgi:hypothetical protein